jgi:hypothetical protein
MRESVPGSVFAAMFRHVRERALLKIPMARKAIVNQAAQDFLLATVRRFGTDDAAVSKTLREVSRLGILEEFNQAVLQDAGVARVIGSGSVLDIIEQEYAGNWLGRAFKSVPRKEALDILRTGQNSFAATPGEYRRYGMWRSLADFGQVCKARPMMSALVIGSVAALGHRYPFLGGASGILIMAWSSTATLIHELLARKNTPRKSMPMSEKRAEHYIRSGENITAFLLTASGADGIWKGTVNGLRAFRNTTGALKEMNPLSRWLKASWAATKSELQEEKMSLFEGLRFVAGLFDNVLLPFNWLADKMGKN